MFQGRQLFSWPGSQNFEYEAPEELIGDGASTSGEFGPFAVSVFLSDANPDSFEFRALRALPTGKVADYRYSVARERSHFLVRMGDKEASKTAFEGSFLVDAETGDLTRLVVEIVTPPTGSGLLHGQIVTDYESKKVGASTALLPRASTTTLVSDQGHLAVNQTQYSDCKEFRSESTLYFGETPKVIASDARKQIPRPPLPAGVKLWTKMITKIDTQETFAGDAVEVEVVKPVRLGKLTLVPRNARLAGRIVRWRRQFYPTRQVVLQIQFDHVEIGGYVLPISLASLGPSEVFESENANSPVRATAGLSSGASVGETKPATITIFGTDRLRLDSRTHWLWQTK